MDEKWIGTSQVDASPYSVYVLDTPWRVILPVLEGNTPLVVQSSRAVLISVLYPPTEVNLPGLDRGV